MTIVWFAAIHLLVVPMIGWADFVVGAEISLALFYLFPVSASAWWFGRLAGIAAAVQCAVVAFTGTYLWSGPESLPVLVWNTLSQVVIFFFTAVFVARLREHSDAGQDALRSTREALAHSHEQLRLLVDGIRERSVMMLDADGGIVLANEGSVRLRGFAAEELVGRPFWTLAASAGAAEGMRRWLAEAATSGSCEFETWEQRRDGSRFCSAGVLSPVLDPQGRLRGYTMVSQDVTRQREAEAAVRSLSARLIGAQEEERRHLARELHDEVGAALTFVKMSLQAAGSRDDGGPLRLAQDAVDQVLDQVRRLSVDLRPSMLDDLGLVPALRWYLDKRARAAGLATEFESAVGEERFDPAVEVTCFRVAQEAVTNVLRHAAASSLKVSLDRADERLELRVKDDGRGFDLARATGLGLSAMAERAALVGGSVRVLSRPGEGTEVLAELPLGPRPATGAPA